MTLKLSHTFMIVDDQDKALAFYRDVLGLELKNDVPLGDERWLTVASPEQPDVEIVLVTASMGHSPQDAESLSALLAKGVLGSAIFATDDLAATFGCELGDGQAPARSTRDRPSAAVRTAGARRAVSSRLAHPVIEIAATACGPPSRTGAATHAIPTVDSSCSSATPRSRIRANSSASSPGATTVRGVRRVSPAATTAASRSGGANANIALPTPVQ
jgi:catechol 2,3-dioxygenase-like lactoylglutathione lyase family enzyme